ncbi:MAG TPA: hypothetical protein VND87_12395 [Stellaceae bacterium]|nr:hypothetical protein [Stellaceae bacterium]
MISLPKLIEIALVIFAVWYTVRWLNRRPAAQPRRRPAAQRTAASPPRVEAEDLVACPVCGAYVAQSARRCGRPTCPRPR